MGSNLSETEPKDIVEEMKEEKKPDPRMHLNIKVIALVVIGLIIVVFLGVIAFEFRTQAEIANNKIAQEEAKPQAGDSAPLQTASPSATPVNLDKEKLKIEILNGSQKAGQAALVEQKLTEIGFSNIITGNAEEATSSSSIAFADQITQVQRDMIMKELQPIIAVNILPEKAVDFDIRLTIGKDFK